MRKQIRRIGLLLLALLFILGTGVTASALNLTVDQAIKWVHSVEGSQVGSGQCVAFVAQYIRVLGGSPPSVDYAVQYSSCTVPAGFTRYAGVQPQTGDILIYSGNSGMGHVGIYESDYKTWHQNDGGNMTVKKLEYYYTLSSYDSSLSYWGVMRPNFASAVAPTTCNLSTSGMGMDGSLQISSGTTQTFNYYADQPCDFYLHVIKNGTDYGRAVSGNSASFTFSETGTYSVWVGAWNSAGSVGSNTLTITVAAPAGKPSGWYTSDSGHNTELDSFSFWWYTVSGATEYNVKVQDAGTGNLIFTSINVANGPIRSHFRAGSYKFKVTAYNSNGEATPGDWVAFTVKTAATPEPGIPVSSFEYDHRLFTIYQKSFDWLEARAVAQAGGGALVSIPNAETQSVVAAAVAGYGMPVWVGGNAVDKTVWCWENGEYFYLSYQYTNWASGCPVTYQGGINNYVVMDVNGKWHDTNNGGYNSSRVTAYMVEATPVSVAVETGKAAYPSGYTLTGDDVTVTVTFSDGMTYNVQDYTMSRYATTTPGYDLITVSYGSVNTSKAIRVYDAMPEADFVLPAGTLSVETGAFESAAMTVVMCPEGLEEIGARAFADCAGLEHIFIPESTQIDDAAFEGCGSLTIWGVAGSPAEAFAAGHGLTFVEFVG